MYFPRAIYIETTNLCNANCVMCPHDRLTRKSGIMDDDLFFKIISECKTENLKGIQIFLHKEGEPLLDNKIAARAKYVKENIGEGNEVCINTNAMLLTEIKSVEIIDSGINTIYFSVDGIDKESFEKIRINLDYDIVVNNIKNFFEIRKLKKSNIRVIMQMLVAEENSIEAEKFRKIWRDRPCEFYIKRMHSYLDGGCSSLTPNLTENQIKVCDDPFKILTVYVDGSVGMCCWDYNNEYSLGNVRFENVFTIYNNEKARNMRISQMEFSAKNIIPCNRCARIFGRDEISKY